MPLTKEEKKKIIKQTTTNENNTGDTQVQIEILSQESKKLSLHFKRNPFDFHSKRGLLMKNRKKNALIKYANKKNKTNNLT
ncbi:MAG: 30S ribosomal protein S15 [Vigna little leaf phytoplasma]|nr:30S ribosomal protein S15 [Vigna little leaf phytoplasma]